MPLLLFVLCLLTVSCSPVVNKRPTPSPVPFTIPPKQEFPRPSADPEKLDYLVSRLNDFSLTLYGALDKDGQPGNLAVSPVGVFFLLELLFEGSVGTTRDQLETLLGRSQSGLKEVELLAWELNRTPSMVQVQKIFVDQPGQIADGYSEKIAPVLGEPIDFVPFGTQEASKTISEWIHKKTGLTQAVPTSQEISCALVSVLCFQGRWVHEFPAQVTAQAEFTPRRGDKLSIPMMHLRDVELPYLEAPDGQGVVLPLNDGVDMVLVLPADGRSLSKALNNVLKATPEEAYFDLKVPRFRVDSPMTNLNDALAKLGLEGVLKDADLSEMLKTEPKTTFDLNAYHRALVAVDEKGAEAKAVSLGLATPAASRTPTEPRFVTLEFDRTFAFALRHQETNALLMVGRVEEPELW